MSQSKHKLKKNNKNKKTKKPEEEKESVGFTDEEIDKLLTQFDDITDDDLELLRNADRKDVVELLESLLKVRENIIPYGQTSRAAEKNKHLAFSFTPMLKQYLTKLIMTSIVAFLNRMCDEYHVPPNVNVVKVYDYLRDPSLIDPPTEEDIGVKLEQDVLDDYEENKEWMEKRVVIKEFLEYAFGYDPDRHVKSSYKSSPIDPERAVVTSASVQVASAIALRKAEKNKEKNKAQYLEAKEQHEIITEHLTERDKLDNVEKKHEKKIVVNIKSKKKGVPPKAFTKIIKLTDQELFDWNKKRSDKLAEGKDETSAETEAMKEVFSYEKTIPTQFTPDDYWNARKMARDSCVNDVVRDLIPPTDVYWRYNNYFDKHYEQLLLATRDLYHEKPDFDYAIQPHGWFNSKEEANEWRIKHASDLKSSVIVSPTAEWSLISAYQANVDRAEYFGQNMALLEEMFKKNSQDQQIGKELIKHRATRAKQRQLKKDPQTKIGKDFMANYGKEARALSSMGVADLADEDEECPDDAVESMIYRIRNGGAKKLETKKIFIEAAAPEVSS
jgi:hypothetical protein